MITLLMAIAAAAAGAPAATGDWVLMTEAANGTRVYVDSGRVIGGPIAQAWIKHEHGRGNPSRSRTNIQLVQFDCAAKTQLLLSSTGYSASGQVTGSQNVRHGDAYLPVPPDSVGQLIFERVCG
jgi:hypothetical protein